MKKKLRISAVLLSAVMLLSAAGCDSKTNPYEKNNSEGYNVSIKYDANGGTFTTNTTTVVDSYKLSELPVNADGEAEIALLSPDDVGVRGRDDAYTVSRPGYFLVGWYDERTEAGKDAETGETLYTYKGKWDFENDRVSVSPDSSYSSTDPVKVLYAVWAPLFEVKFISLDDDTELGSISYDPTDKSAQDDLKVPQWNENKGTVNMGKFPEIDGKTYDTAYYDKAKSLPVESVIEHSGKINYDDGTVADAVMNVYVDYIDGDWFRIYTAKQFVDNASLNGCYEICADLDFADVVWPTSFAYTTFNGTINGNGHSFANIEFDQNDTSRTTVGMFGVLGADAKISDVAFTDASLVMKKGILKAGTSVGLLAGAVDVGATVDGVSVTGKILIDTDSCYFADVDCAIGLLCGDGSLEPSSGDDISCEAIGNKADKWDITVNGNEVTVKMSTDLPDGE